MLTKKELVLVFIVSVFIKNCSSAKNICDDDFGTVANKIAGKWNYIAQVSSWNIDIKCGYLYLQNETDELFTGYWVGTSESEFSNITLKARVINDSFELSLQNSEGYSPGVPMTLTTCNDNGEIALEDDQSEWYYIFSRTNEVSDEFLSNYRLVADMNDLDVVIMDNKNCDEEDEDVNYGPDELDEYLEDTSNDSDDIDDSSEIDS